MSGMIIMYTYTLLSTMHICLYNLVSYHFFQAIRFVQYVSSWSSAEYVHGCWTDNGSASRFLRYYALCKVKNGGTRCFQSVTEWIINIYTEALNIDLWLCLPNYQSHTLRLVSMR